MPDPTEITKLLRAWSGGDQAALDRLADSVYGELRVMARLYMKNERSDNTLQTTALVHEVYLRLVGSQDTGWRSRGHFFAAAAEALRRILIENARRKASQRRGGQQQRCELEDGDRVTCPISDELLAWPPDLFA